jgi:hypothetical protein
MKKRTFAIIVLGLCALAFLLAGIAPCFAGDLTTETLKRCGVIDYSKGFGIEQNKFVLTARNSGRKFYFCDKTPLTSATLIVCAKTGDSFARAADPYYGLSCDQKIAAACADELTSAGYTPALREGIQSNALNALYTSGTLGLTSASQMAIEEGNALRALQEAVKAKVYTQYPNE